ncbi:hypothetical protein D1872_181500 [compost metagenome]
MYQNVYVNYAKDNVKVNASVPMPQSEDREPVVRINLEVTAAGMGGVITSEITMFFSLDQWAEITGKVMRELEQHEKLMRELNKNEAEV